MDHRIAVQGAEPEEGTWFNVMTGSDHCLFSSTDRDEVSRFVREKLIPDADVTIQRSRTPVVA